MLLSLSVDWGSWFSRLSRKAQVAYLQAHPNSKYGTKDVRKEAFDKASTEVQKPKKSKKKVKPTKQEKPVDASETVDDNTSKKKLSAKEKRTRNKDAIAKLDGGMKKAYSRSNNIAKVITKKFKQNIGDTIEYTKRVVTGRKTTEKQQQAAKAVFAGIISALLIAGIGVSIFAGGAAMPLAKILVEEYMAHRQWAAQSADKVDPALAAKSGRYQVETENIVKDIATFIQGYDKQQLLELMDQYDD